MTMGNMNMGQGLGGNGGSGYINMGIARQHKIAIATSIQNSTCTKYTNPSDNGTATYINIVMIIPRPIGIAPLRSAMSLDPNSHS
jgi:hypothetical protein